ncbi:DedA family protein [Aeromicrobium sp. CF4.19]|uniref:DedA family protein n=1 Tax=Aeromicrobium sp. CF4.19 TaxID=3373082 RepID=UPI003EE68788
MTALLLIGLVTIIPFGPVEAAAVTAGTLAHTGLVPLWVAVLPVAIGMLLGDYLVYAAAGPMLDRARPRWANRPRVAAMLSALVAKPLWRDVGVAGLRFVPGGRTPTALMARELRMTRTHFCVVAGAGSLLWAGVWTGGGSALAGGALTLLA